MSSNWLDQVNWNKDGLIAAIAQDSNSGRVLMQAWVNREALELAAQENRAIYWSRSKGRIWRKGEESGNIQKLRGIYLDCDGDAVRFEVEQVGGIACHTGRESCFYLKLESNVWVEAEPVLKDPKNIYG